MRRNIYTRKGIIYQQPGPTPRQPGANTIAYYKINDNDTTSTIYDLSGNNHHLTWYGNGAYTTDANYGRVASFDGSSYASLGGYLDPNSTQYTIIALGKCYNDNDDKHYVSQGSSSSVISTIALTTTAFTYQNPAFPTSWVDYSQWQPLNTWYLMVGVRDNDSLKVYINGVLNNSKTDNSISTDWTSGGYRGLGANRQEYNFLEGEIKTVIFENRAWTQAEIEALAQEYGFTV